MNPFFKSCMRILLSVAVTLLVVFPLLLIFFQHRLIYFPRSYEPGEVQALTAQLVTIPYRTSEGKQVAYFVPPRARPAAPAERVWVVFPGNAMLALDWLGFLGGAPNRRDGFLLIDYPGYGQCEGSASPKAIGESSRAAFAALLNTSGATVASPRLGILGISLGTGAGLLFAVQHPVDKIILIAPFASLLQEARRTVGTPLCYLLRHRFDNVSRLAELAARPSPPRVWIFHGTEDTVIPPTRSRALKAAFPQMIKLTEIEGGGHNTTLDIARTEIFAAMAD
jgi:pimeloyl-ACP methyl ester carboxylesterase